mmetsp:Transcript_33606/g.46536  ORF Transcript_33606/g.46536 Transcript_33606/m.46536 type:complete len:310 (+) Transcript_33606:236-1165(+)
MLSKLHQITIHSAVVGSSFLFAPPPSPSPSFTITLIVVSLVIGPPPSIIVPRVSTTSIVATTTSIVVCTTSVVVATSIVLSRLFKQQIIKRASSVVLLRKTPRRGRRIVIVASIPSPLSSVHIMPSSIVSAAASVILIGVTSRDVVTSASTTLDMARGSLLISLPTIIIPLASSSTSLLVVVVVAIVVERPSTSLNRFRSFLAVPIILASIGALVTLPVPYPASPPSSAFMLGFVSVLLRVAVLFRIFVIPMLVLSFLVVILPSATQTPSIAATKSSSTSAFIVIMSTSTTHPSSVHGTLRWRGTTRTA